MPSDTHIARNRQMRLRWLAGTPVSNIAADEGITVRRVYQILAAEAAR